MCGNILSGIGKAIGNAVKGIGAAVEQIIKNPLPIIMTIALTAAVVATGGLLAPVAAGTAGTLAGGLIAAPIAAGLGGGALATAAAVGIQSAVISAAVSALNGGSISDIGMAALTGGVTAGLTFGTTSYLPDVIGSAVPGITEDMAKVAAGAFGGAAGAAASAAITGRPIDAAALVGGVSGGVTTGIGVGLKGTEFAKEIGTTGVKMLTAVGGASAGAIAGGKNAGYAATMAAVNVALSSSLSNFQSTQKEIQQTIASDPGLKQAAESVGEASQVIKDTPPESIAAINEILKVKEAASNIASQVESVIQKGYGNISWNSQDYETLKATGQFTAQLQQLDQINGQYNNPISVALNLADDIVVGATAYSQSIESKIPDIQAYAEAQQIIRDNTAVLDEATGGKYSEYQSNTQKLISGVDNYEKYSTQVNNGTLTSTPQEDALNAQVKEQLSVFNASYRNVSNLSPDSEEYADAVQKLQADGEKLTNLSAQSAALSNYFKGNSSPVSGTDVSDVIVKNGGNIDFANSVAGYYTDTGAVSPVATALDGNGNVILATRDAYGGLSNVYSVGTNGSQVATVDQLKTIASSGDSDAVAFANDASIVLTGSRLPTLTPEDNLIGAVAVTDTADGSLKYFNAATNKFFNPDGTEFKGTTNAQVTPPPGEVTSPTTVPSYSYNLNSSGISDSTPGTIYTNENGEKEFVLNNGKTVSLSDYQAAQASGKPISVDGVFDASNTIPKGTVTVSSPPPDFLEKTPSTVGGTAQTTPGTNPEQAAPTNPALPTYKDTPIAPPLNGSVEVGGIYPDVPLPKTNDPTPGAGTEDILNAVNAANQAPNVSGGSPTTNPVQTPNTGTNVAETAPTTPTPNPADNPDTTTSILDSINAVNNTPNNTTSPTGGVSPTPTPTAGGGTGTTAPSTTDNTAGGNVAGTGTGVAGTGTGDGGTGAGTGTGAGGTGTGTGGASTGGGGGGGLGIKLGIGAGAGALMGSQYRTPTMSDMAVRSGRIADLTPGIARGSQFEFANDPDFDTQVSNMQAPQNVDYTQQILNAAAGGLVGHYSGGGEIEEDLPTLQARLMRGRPFQGISRAQGVRLPGYQEQRFAEGGEVEGHNPQFFSEGGLNSLENRYVSGEGDGTSDSIPAMLANGEFVIPADVVSGLGNGSNNAGAKVLDNFLSVIREHRQKHDSKQLPPDSKGALAYLLDAKRKVG